MNDNIKLAVQKIREIIRDKDNFNSENIENIWIILDIIENNLMLIEYSLEDDS